MSCFVEDKGLNAMSRCLDPFLALDPLNASRPPSVPTQIERCESLCHDAEFACLHLRAEDQLLRISNIPFGTRYQRNEVLLWRGPPSEIWNHGAPAHPHTARINADGLPKWKLAITSQEAGLFPCMALPSRSCFSGTPVSE